MLNAPSVTELDAVAPEELDAWTRTGEIEHRSAGASASTLEQEVAPFERREITDPTAYPYRVQGKLFARAEQGIYHCSATVLESPNDSVVFTAAHCLYGEELGGWVDKVMFVPGYRFGNRPYGEWVAGTALVTPGWLTDESARVDIGALIMDPLGGEPIVDVVGGRSFESGASKERHFEAFGYPAAAPFDGERLFVCEADTYWIDPSVAGTGPDPLGIGCDMTGGASGGGWIVNGTTLNSLNSYGYADESGNAQPYMFGPYFGNAAQSLFLEAGAVPVDLPTPLPSASESPTAIPTVDPSATPPGTPTPTPTVTIPAPRIGSVVDADDTRGRLDIAAATVEELDRTITVEVRTHGAWRNGVLSAAHPRNFFYVDFDTIGSGAEDYYVTVFARNGRLVGKVLEYAPGRDPIVGDATITRADRRSFQARVGGDLLHLEEQLRWFASSNFKSGTACPRVCKDFAPNRTMVSI